MPLRPPGILEESWTNILLSSSKRRVTMDAFVNLGGGRDLYYWEDWCFESDATLGDFYAKWSSVGSRSIEEHRSVSDRRVPYHGSLAELFDLGMMKEGSS